MRADGVWKIKRLDYMMQWQADYEQGWSRTVAHLQPATQTYPANPLGPDVLLPESQVRRTWPHRQDVPMHFAHPRFGAALAKPGRPGARPTRRVLRRSTSASLWVARPLCVGHRPARQLQRLANNKVVCSTYKMRCRSGVLTGRESSTFRGGT